MGQICPYYSYYLWGYALACNSGKVYSDCCNLHHTNTFGTYTAFNSIISSEPSKAVDKAAPLAIGSPEAILRARYTAYKHGNAEYVLGSTHPTSEDYLKFIEEQKATLKSGKTKWAKEVLKMSVDYDYYGIEIINSKISKNKEKATVLFRALYKEGESFMAVEENAIFLKFKGDIQETFTGRTAYSKDGPNLINTAPISAKFDTSTTASGNNKWGTENTAEVKKINESSRWLFYDSENIDLDEEIARKMVEEWPLRPENDVDSDGRNKRVQENDKSLLLSSSAPPIVAKNLKRPALREKSGGLLSQPSIPLGKGRA
eukprot:CAMPEP_0119042526 /NCGR_PEP_ID=MMETSP1177-20130426/15726_1 /TAXON_ID=2985 /ORGANISM="Ochromonas sp, Strain CCMP1899" /LENGTH=315 /DNA_ID=CAMNT_0007009397 /DNA_START=224 /DNA_END=1172 /DNA_ORIENTATION=-